MAKEWTQTDIDNFIRQIQSDWTVLSKRLQIVRNSGISCSMLAQMTGFSERAVSDLLGSIEKDRKDSKLFHYYILTRTISIIYLHLPKQTIKKAQRRIYRKQQRLLNKPKQVIVRPETDKNITYD